MCFMFNIVFIVVCVRVGVIFKDCFIFFKFIVGGVDVGVDDIGGVFVFGIVMVVVDVIC